MKFAIKILLLVLIFAIWANCFKRSSLKKRNNETTTQNESNSNTTQINATDEEEEDKEHDGNCFVKINNQIYNFNGLSQDCRTYNVHSDAGSIFDFNFCSDIETDCGTHGLFVNKEKCTIYASSAKFEKKFVIVDVQNRSKVKYRKNATEEQKQLKEGQLLRMYLPPGGPCETNKSQNYQITYDVVCDSTEPSLKIDNSPQYKFDPNRCTNVIVARSQFGCPKEKFRPWWKQLGVNKKILGMLMILFGLYFLFVGEKLFKVNAIIIIGISLGMLIFTLANSYAKVSMIACIVAGFILSTIFFVCFFDMIISVIGTLIGYFAGNFVYNFEIKLLNGSVDPVKLYWVTLLVFFILGYIITHYIKTLIIIIASSIIGGYAFVRGISIYAKGFPDETYVMKLIQNNEFNRLSKVFNTTIYYYLAAIVVVTFLGIVVQIQMQSDTDLKKDEPKPEGEVSFNDGGHQKI